MNTTDQDILKKLLQDALTVNEKEALTNSVPVSIFMRKQWNEAPDAARLDQVDPDKIWNNIRMEVWGKGNELKLRYYRIYSLVASVLLLLTVGVSYLLTRPNTPAIHYIASSGIQNMESVNLPDGSVVQLGPGSRLTYPSRFTGEKREVQLCGQAFFDVVKDKSHPFVVQSNDMEVTALGTAFEVFSYEGENKIEAILLKGKIKVNLCGNDKKTEVILLPNEKLILSRDTRSVVVEAVNADKYSAWRNHGILSFENETLSMIIPRLEQWYGRKVMCNKDIASTYRFTFKVRDESLERILFMFSKSSPIRYKQVNENYELCLLK